MTENQIKKIEICAYLRSAKEPTQEQKERLCRYLEKKYNKKVSVLWKEDKSIKDGFRIEVGSSVYKWTLDEIYDWSNEGKTRQLKEKVKENLSVSKDVMSLVRQTINEFEAKPQSDEIGTVLTVGDGIATLVGLENAQYGEILLFECGIKGMILDLQPDTIGCVIFGDESDIAQGSVVYRTKKLPVFRLVTVI